WRSVPTATTGVQKRWRATLACADCAATRTGSGGIDPRRALNEALKPERRANAAIEQLQKLTIQIE
ncbi:MAG TPA: hypothetical protein VK761_04110, partial [Solirubrobacteraceae bacterium]|nr:hypothetical protein [Solirubrobacteraceae bacterium]